MNKYTIITLLILSLILIAILITFDIDYKWYYFIPIYFISNYNGKVMYQTFKGFNINNIWFTEKNEDKQHFISNVVLGFTGNTKDFYGVFDNSLNIEINQLRMLLYNNTNRNDVVEALKKANDYSKTYKFNNQDIKITFYNK